MLFIKAFKEDFESLGISVNAERIVDGKCIKHKELLTSEQLSTINGDSRFIEITESQIPLQVGD